MPSQHLGDATNGTSMKSSRFYHTITSLATIVVLVCVEMARGYKMPLPATGSSASLSSVASTLIQSLPNVFERLRELEAEEKLLDAKTESLMVQRDKSKATHPTALYRTVVTPALQRRRPATTATAVKENHACHDDRVAETPKTPKKIFLFKDALTSTMSVKSKRKGRIFVVGVEDTNVALERRRNVEVLSMLP
ncbi:hypothetical protein F5I97DRAFT_436631 [Phlebopus sp. FC_14]|nr:hypothetical protein F5I97DRAFT_436631 [Phlebopus sp. FC_14]